MGAIAIVEAVYAISAVDARSTVDASNAICAVSVGAVACAPEMCLITVAAVGQRTFFGPEVRLWLRRHTQARTHVGEDSIN